MPRSVCSAQSTAAQPDQTISWWRTGFGDEEILRITQAIRSEHISQGPVVSEFEERLAEFLGVPYVVATTSCSMSQLMAFMAIDLAPGDEVIIPNRTWISAAHAVVMLGGKVKLVDLEADRQIIDRTRIEEAITPRTRAIVPTHLNGQAANMPEINHIAQKHGLRVIEDAAQALGSRNPDGLLGTQSDMGCFSLSIAKIIATGQGGFIATRDRALYERLTSIRGHGVANVVQAQWTQLGFNFRFTDILASIGLVQLRHIGERMEKLKAIYARYREGVSQVPYLEFLPVNLEAGELPLYTQVLCKDREELIVRLESLGVQARPFYPNLNRAGYLENVGSFPNSERFGEQGLILPSGPTQSLENIDRVLEILNSREMISRFASR